MSSPEKSTPYKVVVFGSGGVGKSSITLRFVTDTFSSEYLPTIEDCYRKQCVVDGIPAFLDILDTAGQEEYSALRDQWVREGDAFLLVYSITSRSSYDEIEAFRERILLVNEDQTVPMVLVANKCDMQHERQVTYEQGQVLARACGGIPFVECSALKSLNCDRVFYECVRETRRIQTLQQQAAHPTDTAKKSWCTIL